MRRYVAWAAAVMFLGSGTKAVDHGEPIINDHKGTGVCGPGGIPQD